MAPLRGALHFPGAMAKLQAMNGRAARRVRKSHLKSSLASSIKAASGRKDISFQACENWSSEVMDSVKIEDRGGFPLKLKPGAVHPRDWRTAGGVRVTVDFGRAKWLPDDWGQGIKATTPNGRSTGGTGGTLTTFVAPNGKTMFYHKPTSEEHAGRTLTEKDGWNGQVRLAQLQAFQTMQAARAQSSAGAGASVDDGAFLKLLSAAERKVMPAAEDFHFAVVSARRASKPEGVADIFTVELKCKEAGVTPTWYVDKDSLQDYRRLGLNAVVGGKLTEARNKALTDASKKGKLCVQVSDDISMWQYTHGKPAAVRGDDEMNLAHKIAHRFVVSPVAAAKFIAAKMRGAVTKDGRGPKLGGVYPLGRCARTFCEGAEFGNRHFVLGDFFVVDVGSKVRFDETMKLKEDYDFTAAHLSTYGSVVRCNWMTLSVKHYANAGGACTNRDGKGAEERRNISILMEKWPGAFRKHPTRKNEVVLSWKKDAQAALGPQDEDEQDGAGKALEKSPGKAPKAASGKAAKIQKAQKKSPVSPVKKTVAKFATVVLRPGAYIVKGEGEPLQSYIARRVAKVVGGRVRDTVGVVTYSGSKGSCLYRVSDLKYDLVRRYIKLRG